MAALMPREVPEEAVPWARADTAPAPSGVRDLTAQPFQAFADRLSDFRARKGKLTLAEELARADLKLRTSEFVMIQMALLVLFALLGLLRYGFGPQFVSAGVAGCLIPMRYVRHRQRKRLKAFNQRLTDTLTMLANAMRAGYSFPQAIDSVAKTASAPVSEEFGRVVREMNLGAPIDLALANLVKRVASDDLDLIVTAALIHNQVGGNLAKILDSISHTIRERVKVKGQISALTAQARASGWIITLLPFVVAGFLYLITPGYFGLMLHRPAGIVMLAVAAFSIFIGNLMIRRLVAIRV
ncbi:MAG TPA: type II secretion system F family protein [Candidatus Dormibacteraeota bacterium]